MTESRALSFAADIRPLFTVTDVNHMKRYDLDLSSYDEVKEAADSILATVTSGKMPPPGTGDRWSADMCETFEAWMKQGCPP